MNTTWINLIRRALDGKQVNPRGETTRELLGDTLVVDLDRPVLTVATRRLGYRFLPAEAAWVLSGDDRVETIVPYAPVLKRFSDDGRTFFGAYGPRIIEQLPYVIEALVRDPSTRQAVISTWRPNPPTTRDCPCTLACQFLIRARELHLVVTMRSSDVWLGVPYDVHTFSMLAGYVILKLRDCGVYLKLGNLTQFAGSRHLYERNAEAARSCLVDDSSKIEVNAFNPHEFESSSDLVAHLWAIARQDRSDLRGRYLIELLP